MIAVLLTNGLLQEKTAKDCVVVAPVQTRSVWKSRKLEDGLIDMKGQRVVGKGRGRRGN